MHWTAATDVDLTLVRSIGADGSVGVTGPWGLATVSGTPSGSISDTDTRTNSLKFANSFQKAVARFGNTCSGPDPSETRMGLANWFEGSVKAIDKDSLVSLSFTKQFKVAAAAGARFGYTLIPVTNTVTAGAGIGGTSDYSNRFTIALTPPPPPAPPPKPLLVHVTNFPKPAPSPDDGRFKTEAVPPSSGTPEATPRVFRPSSRRAPPRSVPRPALTPRERVLQDPALNQMLQRQSPVILAPNQAR